MYGSSGTTKALCSDAHFVRLYINPVSVDHSEYGTLLRCSSSASANKENGDSDEDDEEVEEDEDDEEDDEEADEEDKDDDNDDDDKDDDAESVNIRRNTENDPKKLSFMP